ncbi:MAG TPA: hypothetical protein VMV02_08135 [Acidimicrobiales bacterium]|nr:hypothetical protein [Acidimicrobiales bacterium]
MADRRERVERPSLEAVRSAGEPLVESSLASPPADSVEIDSVTGLPHLSYLVERIQELQDEAREQRGPRRVVLPGHVLLVVSIAGGEDRHAALFLRARTASLLRAIFSGDETIALLRHGLFGVLAADRRDLAADREFLTAMLEDFDVRARVWVERIPADGPGTASLLSTLLLAGDWDSDE